MSIEWQRDSTLRLFKAAYSNYHKMTDTNSSYKPMSGYYC